MLGVRGLIGFQYAAAQIMPAYSTMTFRCCQVPFPCTYKINIEIMISCFDNKQDQNISERSIMSYFIEIMYYFKEVMCY